jgi:hypothetical protein
MKAFESAGKRDTKLIEIEEWGRQRGFSVRCMPNDKVVKAVSTTSRLEIAMPKPHIIAHGANATVF